MRVQQRSDFEFKKINIIKAGGVILINFPTKTIKDTLFVYQYSMSAYFDICKYKHETI